MRASWWSFEGRQLWNYSNIIERLAMILRKEREKRYLHVNLASDLDSFGDLRVEDSELISGRSVQQRR